MEGFVTYIPFEPIPICFYHSISERNCFDSNEYKSRHVVGEQGHLEGVVF